MSEDANEELAEHSEEFRSFSTALCLSRYLPMAGLMLAINAAMVCIQWIRGEDIFPLIVNGLLTSAVFPLISQIGQNPSFVFSEQGIIGKKITYTWDRVTRVERVPMRIWLARKPQEALRVYIKQDPPPPLTAIRAWLRDKGILGQMHWDYGCIVNTPDCIDHIIAAMEKYSGRDFSSTSP